MQMSLRTACLTGLNAPRFPRTGDAEARSSGLRPSGEGNGRMLVPLEAHPNSSSLPGLIFLHSACCCPALRAGWDAWDRGLRLLGRTPQAAGMW